jgi:hypothetical protein
MRKLLLAGACAGFISLGGCTTTGQFDLTTFITQVQGATSQLCAFIPTAETVATILAAGDPLVATAGAVADAICKAFGPAPPKASLSARRLAAAPVTIVVNGKVIEIHGKFTR